jgi:hypothetical protein
MYLLQYLQWPALSCFRWADWNDILGGWGLFSEMFITTSSFRPLSRLALSAARWVSGWSNGCQNIVVTCSPPKDILPDCS